MEEELFNAFFEEYGQHMEWELFNASIEEYGHGIGTI